MKLMPDSASMIKNLRLHNHEPNSIALLKQQSNKIIPNDILLHP